MRRCDRAGVARRRLVDARCRGGDRRCGRHGRPDRGREGASARGARGRRSHGGRRHARLRHQHRVWILRRRAHRARRARSAPDQPAAQSCGRRRRRAPRLRRPGDDGAARQRPGPRPFRYPPRDARTAHRDAQCLGASRGAQPWIGGRQRRPGAAGPPGAGADWRRRGADCGRTPARRRGAGPRRIGPCAAGAKRGPRAHQRHAGLHGRARAGAGGGRAPRPGRRHRRGPVDRRAARVHAAV